MQERESKLSYTPTWEVIQEPYRTSISIIRWRMQGKLAAAPTLVYLPL